MKNFQKFFVKLLTTRSKFAHPFKSRALQFTVLLNQTRWDSPITTFPTTTMTFGSFLIPLSLT